MPRERVLAERELDLRAVERLGEAVDFVRAVFAAVPVLADPPLRFAAEAERVAPDLAVLDFAAPDFARVDEDFAAPPPELRDDPEDEEPDELSSPPHLPLITRCAASATASAMMLPSLVALDIMLLAACDAVSAASSPASRILRRALGLALIAAAAAARPAASISLLIAALAILSIVSLPDEADDLVPDELFLGDFAIVNSSLWKGKTLKGRNGSQMTDAARLADNVKGTATVK